MEKKFSNLVLRLMGRKALQPVTGINRGRATTVDIAYNYRMGAGAPGDPNRTHPMSIEPCMIDGAAPPLAYGIAAVYDRNAVNGVRQVTTTDTVVDGVTVRPYPQQQASATNYGAANFGAAVPPTSGAIDLLKRGYIMVILGGAAQPVKGGAVFVWTAVSSGLHVQGAFEAAATAGSTIALSAASYFNGPADASGIVELAYNG